MCLIRFADVFPTFFNRIKCAPPTLMASAFWFAQCISSFNCLGGGRRRNDGWPPVNHFWGQHIRSCLQKTQGFFSRSARSGLLNWKIEDQESQNTRVKINRKTISATLLEREFVPLSNQDSIATSITDPKEGIELKTKLSESVVMMQFLTFYSFLKSRKRRRPNHIICFAKALCELHQRIILELFQLHRSQAKCHKFQI